MVGTGGASANSFAATTRVKCTEVHFTLVVGLNAFKHAPPVIQSPTPTIRKFVGKMG